MERTKQQLYIVMDESAAPYEESQYTRTTEDDLSIIRLARKYNLELMPDSRLAKLSKQLEAGRQLEL